MPDILHPSSFLYCDPNWTPLKVAWSAQTDEDPRALGYGGRDFQPRCFDRFHGKRLTLLISPTGSGKSLMQVFCAAREIIESDYTQRQVFIVPQRNIGKGFAIRDAQDSELSGETKYAKLRIGKIYDWHIERNCCMMNGGSVEGIRTFLLSRSKHNSARRNQNIGVLAASVSYAALVQAWSTFTEEEKEYIIRTTSFRIDESHHINSIEDDAEINRMGCLVNEILKRNGSLHLITATFFRGDRHSILNDLNGFEVFRVPFLEHWKTLGLRELHQNYHSYKDAKDLLKQILRNVSVEPQECPLIIVPSDGHKFFRQGNKWEFVTELVRGLERIFGVDEVLDLVSPDRQKQDKPRLITGRQNFKAVVTCMIGREGTDWPACSRIHNTVLDANALQPIQKLGRGLRSYVGKVAVKMINYIEYFSSWDADKEDIRRRLSDRFNAVVVASMLDDMLFPILMPSLPCEGTQTAIDTVRTPSVSLDDIFGESRNALIEDLIRRSLTVPDRTPEALDEIIEELLIDYDGDILVDVDHDVLVMRLRHELLRRFNPTEPNLILEGLDIGFVRLGGWDKVVADYITPNSPFDGLAKTKDLENLQTFLRSDFDANIAEIRTLGGIPNVPKNSRLWHWILAKRREVARTERAA